MKIAYLYIVDLNLNSASVNQTLNMVNAFADHAEVHFLSSWIKQKDIDNRLIFFALPKKFSLKRMPIIWLKNAKIKRLERISRLLYVLFCLIYIRFNNYDLIYTRDFSFVYFLSLLPSFLRPKSPVIYEPHKIYYESLPNVSQQQEAKALATARLFVPTTVGCQEDLEEIFHIPHTKMYQHANGVNLETFEKITASPILSEKYPRTKGKKIILYTGTFLDWKGVDTLVKATRYIQHSDYMILLIGGFGKDRQTIEKLIEEEGAKEQIIVDGFLSQQELIAILKQADLAIIPNRLDAEGNKYTSPLKTYEYLAVGLPIVCSDLYSMRQILVENENALFFEPENEQDLAAKIDLILEDDTLQKQLSQNNKKAAPLHSWQKRAAQIIAFIKLHLNFK